MTPLTPRQRELYNFICASVRERGYPPTLREIAAFMGVTSTNGANDHLRALERKGYIRRDSMAARAIKLVARVDVGAAADVRLQRLVTLAERLDEEAATARLGRRPDVAGRLAVLANEARLIAFDLRPGSEVAA